MKFNVQYNNKKPTKNASENIFNTIDNKFNKYVGISEDPVQKTLEEKLLAPNIKNYKINEERFKNKKDSISRIHSKAKFNNRDDDTL